MDRARDEPRPVSGKMFIKRACYTRGLRALNLMAPVAQGTSGKNINDIVRLSCTVVTEEESIA